MALRIEDYALVGDTETAALVGTNGSIDWLCAPRFDSPAFFAALLGTDANGHWQIAPRADVRRVERRYRPGTLVLETDFETDDGLVRLVDCMPLGDGHNDVVRIVEGLRGRVEMQMQLNPRFDYGKLIPATGRIDQGMFAVAGADAVCLRTPVELGTDGAMASAAFTVSEGERVPFHLAWYPSHAPRPEAVDPLNMVARAESWWREWSGRCTYEGPHSEVVLRSLITLKALTYSPTGAIVAALTTSLPEEIGGERNWDYRFCWLRDGSFTLAPLVQAGYTEEAVAWRDWLLRAIAGDPSQLQLMYGIGGEHRLTELELPWLSGYEGSTPVRIGNAASEQFQLDIFGEVMAVLYGAWEAGLPQRDPTRSPGIELSDAIGLVERMWREPDEGIWEVRGEPQHFTYSKVSAWTAIDRAIRISEATGADVPLDRWRAVRDEIHAEVLAKGFDTDRNTFVQYYGGTGLDASLLLIPIFGFLPPQDPRVLGTIDAIQREICDGPFVFRYSTDEGVDGLAGSEGAFLICSFWLVSALAKAGRVEEAERNLEQLMALQNDVGLLSEEYEPRAERLLGNFPQAFSHIGLMRAIYNISEARNGG
ncbi:MAG TPA: glycoside hydrolase family 15 protein [Actinomycetota bacterium]|nr:glycoside hydrolase family 15 protein [Actinomycetota bacterium]